MTVAQPTSNGKTIPTHDLAHHLSEETRLRLPSTIKEIVRLIQSRENIVTLANGDPDPVLYPIQEVLFKVAPVDECDPVSAWLSDSSSPDTFRPQTVPEAGTLTAGDSLVYGPGVGLKPVVEALQALVQVFHSPKDHVVTLNLGNADGVTKLFRLLGDQGDAFLADELSFTALSAAAIPHGVKWVPVRLDAGGIIPEDLEYILKTWNEQTQGRIPHVIYTTPCGQNPTGSTLDLKRRNQIYRIAQEWDLIIVEDDPYYFLQFDRPELDQWDPNFVEKYSRSLTPSFLSMDVDGRVMRCDSFSKIIAPGLRLGMFTTSAMFQGHLVKLIDNSTQQPGGLSQLFITEMLGERGWKMDGFARWTNGICREYQRRRDNCIDVFNRKVAPTGYATVSRPQAGMFVWIEVHVERHPRYCIKDQRQQDQTAPRTNCDQLMQELFWKCLDAGVALITASDFLLSKDPRFLVRHDGHIQDRLNYFRATYAGPEETVNEGFAIFAKALTQFFSA